MNEVLIQNWNNVVKAEDTVYIVGDLGFGSKQSIRKLLQRMNGMKVLILGNHDRKSMIPKEQFVCIEPIMTIRHRDYVFIVQHDPAIAASNHLNDSLYICGHLHSDPEHRMYRNWIDVGIDANNFIPISIEQVIEYFKEANLIK